MILHMKQRELTLMLSGLRPHADPKPELEQYSTPAEIASEIIYAAAIAGDISGRDVADFGCGTGIFAIGAMLMGAKRVTALDTDEGAIEISMENARAFLPPSSMSRIKFLRMDVADYSGMHETVLQNPPFGARKRNADMPFLVRGMECSNTLYTLHQYHTDDFITAAIERLGGKIVWKKEVMYSMPSLFSFHTHERREFRLILYKVDSVQ